MTARAAADDKFAASEAAAAEQYEAFAVAAAAKARHAAKMHADPKADADLAAAVNAACSARRER